MKNWKIPAIIGGVLLLLVMMIAGSYNGMVASRESVNTAWSKVESQYQRRSDLIPNLVNTVKGAANFEQETLTKVVEARAKATQIKVDANNPDDIAKFQQAQSEVSSSLSRLLAVAENYPQLKATENFKDLQSQLEGTENRITVARNDFNDAARSYNTKIKSFPANLPAGMFGFKENGRTLRRMPTPRKLRRLISVRQLNKKISYALAKLGGIGSGVSSNSSGGSSGGSFGGGGFSGGGASGGW